jgi:streptogramin lyase
MNRIAIVSILVAVIAVSALGAFAVYTSTAACNPQKATETTTSHLDSTTFGAVTEYAFPRTGNWANAVTVASDGSVWFGEQALPGVAQFDPTSGQLTEYKWSCYATPQSGGPVTSIWGVVQWNGQVWATDGSANRLIGLNPSDGSLTYVNTTSASFPYLLAPSPDGSLWFTTLSTKPLLASLKTDLSLAVYPVSGIGKEEPIQILFENATHAYMVALNPDSTKGEGGLYSFDPQTSTGTIVATRVGGNFSLYFPDGLSQTGNEIFVTQHYPSNIVEYNLKTGAWTTYPTSLVSYSYTTLPYFVEATSSGVWFNEHYGNKIAVLNQNAGRMTEFSEANPPITNGTQIQNDLTIALGQNGLWFTSTSGDYLGFVNGSYTPPFSIQAATSNTLSLSQGGSTTLHFQLGGTWSGPLRVLVSDSENITSVPKFVSIQPGTSIIPAGAGLADLPVMISATRSLPPGTYTIAVTVTDGLVYQTAFVYLTIG